MEVIGKTAGIKRKEPNPNINPVLSFIANKFYVIVHPTS